MIGSWRRSATPAPARSEQRHEEHGHRRDRHLGQIGPDVLQRLRKTVGVERDGEGLGKEQREADCGPDLHSETARDDVVGASRTDLHVRRNG